MTPFLTRFSQAGIADTAPPAGLQLLLDRAVPTDEQAIRESIRLFHEQLANAEVEWIDVTQLPNPPEIAGEGPPAKILALVSWGQHVIKIAGFEGPMPAAPLSRTLAHTLFVPDELKQLAAKHRSHLLFDYAGSDPDPTHRYASLAAIVGAIANFGGIVALNEEARSCIPAAALQPEDKGEDIIDVLEKLPLPYLYAGFAKMELSDPPGMIWYRMFLNSRFGLPNLAMRGEHSDFTNVFQLFSALSNYLRETQVEVVPGEKIRVDENRYYGTRNPIESEWYLDSEEGITIVLEATSE